VIAQSVMQLLASRDGEQTWLRAIAAIRHGFGGHLSGADAGIARVRRQGRIGDAPGDEGAARGVTTDRKRPRAAR